VHSGDRADRSLTIGPTLAGPSWKSFVGQGLDNIQPCGSPRRDDRGQHAKQHACGYRQDDLAVGENLELANW
jgi:hypothetical protein